VRRHRPSTLELMDRATIAAVERWQPMGLDLEAEAMLFARSDVGRVEGREEIEAMRSICEVAGADLAVTTDEEAEGRMLMAARRLAFSALEREGTTLVEAIAKRHGVTIGTFGHAGDGNMHPTVVYDHRDEDAVARARAAFDDILTLARSLGGTISGEHGVGLLKASAAADELADTMDLQRAVKAAFDPTGLLNPGKGPGGR
jgi:glycolate oxidase